MPVTLGASLGHHLSPSPSSGDVPALRPMEPERLGLEPPQLLELALRLARGLLARRRRRPLHAKGARYPLAELHARRRREEARVLRLHAASAAVAAAHDKGVRQQLVTSGALRDRRRGARGAKVAQGSGEARGREAWRGRAVRDLDDEVPVRDHVPVWMVALCALDADDAQRPHV